MDRPDMGVYWSRSQKHCVIYMFLKKKIVTQHLTGAGLVLEALTHSSLSFNSIKFYILSKKGKYNKGMILEVKT
ncbi:hypothetical protein AMQ84_08360 [Paenibacillus riograndensis]|uniref:Uncharacterized protein n=1 Tax=Paenibacillus riograndensis TaxID=483937 RepID=A0A132U5E9_9BACL|nr:hypothetical protein AMQ84_08360 [Paenibacillus riograndensis]